MSCRPNGRSSIGMQNSVFLNEIQPGIGGDHIKIYLLLFNYQSQESGFPDRDIEFCKSPVDSSLNKGPPVQFRPDLFARRSCYHEGGAFVEIDRFGVVGQVKRAIGVFSAHYACIEQRNSCKNQAAEECSIEFWFQEQRI